MKEKKNSLYILFVGICITPTHNNSHNDIIIHNYFWANYSNFSGNKNSARTHYEHLINSHAPIYTYKGYLHFLFDTKQYKKITDLIPQLDKQFSHDAHIQLLFVHTFEKCNQQKEADERIMQLSETCSTHSEITFRASQAYLKSQQPEKALEVIDKYLNKTPRHANNFVFYFLKSQIYITQNELTQALENIQKCLDMHPNFDKGWLSLATLKEQAGCIEDAIKGYTTFLKISGRNPQIEQHVFQLTMKKNMNDIFVSKTVANKSPYESAIYYYQQKQHKHANTYIDKHLMHNPTDTQARLLKIQILSALKEFTKATELICEWFDKEPHKRLWTHTLFLLLHAGIPQAKLENVFQTLEKKHPQSPWPTLYLADLAVRSKKQTQAITYLEKSLLHITKPILRTKILHHIGLLYFEQQDYEKMAQTLEQAYAQDNKFAPVANDLAYCLAQQKNCDIQRAQRLISQALKQDTTNPLYIDTQAMIYLKQKKYTEAEQLLQPLQISTNPIILLNLAEIKYALDKKTDAQALTEKAAKYATLVHEKNALKKMQDLLYNE